MIAESVQHLGCGLMILGAILGRGKRVFSSPKYLDSIGAVVLSPLVNQMRLEVDHFI